MKTLAQKAREIVGHEEGCPRHGARPEWVLALHNTNEPSCTCPPLPLHVRVAAGLGDLRREHTQAGPCCVYCGAQAHSANMTDHGIIYGIIYSHINGFCAPPLDAARAWRLLVATARADQDGPVLEVEGMWSVAIQPYDLPPHGFHGISDTPEEAVAFLYEALHDAGLLT